MAAARAEVQATTGILMFEACATLPRRRQWCGSLVSGQMLGVELTGFGSIPFNAFGP